MSTAILFSHEQSAFSNAKKSWNCLVLLLQERYANVTAVEKNVCWTKNVTKVTKNVTEVTKIFFGTKNVTKVTKHVFGTNSMAVYGRVASYGSIIWRIVALYRIILPYIALYRIISHYIALYRIISHYIAFIAFIALYRIILHYIALYRMISPFLAVIDPNSFGLVYGVWAEDSLKLHCQCLVFTRFKIHMILEF